MITKEERAKILEAAAREHIRNDPNIDRFVLAQLIIAASDRFIGPVEEEEKATVTETLDAIADSARHARLAMGRKPQ